MREWKRIFCNRIWIAAAVLCLLGTLGTYVQNQRERVGGSFASYRQATDQLEEVLAGREPAEGLFVLEERGQELKSWMAASFLARRQEDGIDMEQELDSYYREQYPQIQEQIELVRQGKGPEHIASQMTALEQWKRRLAYQAGYEESIRTVMDEAQRIQNSPLFAAMGSFDYKNAGVTARDYQRIADVSLEVITDDVVSSLAADGSSLVFGLILMAVTVIFLLLPRGTQLEMLTEAAAGGRVRLALWRLGAVILTGLGTALATAGGVLLTGSLLYGQPVHWGAAAQSMELLSNWTEPGTVGEFLLWFLGMRAIGLILMGLLL